MAASVSGIGAKVGQSMSGLWSSLSSGIASSLLNRSLGLTNDDVARMESPTTTRTPSQSIGAGTNISGGVIPPDIPALQRENTNEKKRLLAENTAAADRDGNKGDAPTLIDEEIETLYAGFQKRRKSHQEDIGTEGAESDWREVEEKGRKLKREEAKIRALNRNGRSEYSNVWCWHDQELMRDSFQLTTVFRSKLLSKKMNREQITNHTLQECFGLQSNQVRNMSPITDVRTNQHQHDRFPSQLLVSYQSQSPTYIHPTNPVSQTGQMKTSGTTPETQTSPALD
jgi:hypothetical protein